MTSVLAAAATVGALALAPQPATAEPIVLPDVLAALPIDTDDILTCTQLVPHTVSMDSTRVQLDVRILLDGVGRAEAKRGVASMRKAYAPLNISVVPTYKKVRFTGIDADGLTAQAKRLYGGKRPPGTDVVYTLTSKDITAGATGDNVAGLADCIGGVRFANHAFAVGEDFPAGSGLSEGTGKTMAHEIGHLLGAHHHYTSPEGLLAPDPNLLDLMAPFLDLCSLKFSTVNSLMVRGHAQKYARP